MKITVTFKTPNAKADALEEIIDEPDCQDEDIERAAECLNRYIAYGEIVTIEFDTKANTATVLTVQ